MDTTRLVESFYQGHSLHAYHLFGAHCTYEGQAGVRFTLWAPHAQGVQIIGDFNNWDGCNHYMFREENGLFSLFIPGLSEGVHYKYRIIGRNGVTLDKADPYAFFSEVRPRSASIVTDLDSYKWHDTSWMKHRTKNFDRPVNVYEVHAGAWKMNDGTPYTYTQLADELIDYCVKMGFTHIEFMPLNEHPFDGSWGYQASGYFSCTSRYGTPQEFMALVDKAHQAQIGIIMDMVPVHFVKDAHGLRYFDGEALYEYPKEEDAHSEWGTMNFDLWKEEVRSFLMSAAGFWADKFHVDGLRFDAVSNIIFWGGNKNRGVNEGALAFVRRMNYYLSKEYQGIMLIAEDSSDFPKVTHSTLDGGLGFDYKWDLGWMNDTLKYYKRDPIYRQYHHNDLTFSMAYFYSEKFFLPLSHDEVVHGKLTILDRMWGNYDQKFAQARNLYMYMMAHPGKKLNFMGNEIASFREFDEAKENDWFLLTYPRHDCFHHFFQDLNHVYLNHPCFSVYDHDYSRGFRWIDADNHAQSIYSFYREDENEIIVCVFNMTPASYEEFELGVPQRGTYTELMNSDVDRYEGYNMCNYTPIRSKKTKQLLHGFENRIKIRVAPFAAIYFSCKKTKTREKKNVKK